MKVHRGPRVRLDGEDGIALPLTIFVIAIATLMLASLYTRVQVDRRIAEASGDFASAAAIAQSGLQTYLATDPIWVCRAAVRPPDGDSSYVSVTGGYADVVAYVVREPTDTVGGTWTYIVRSTGYVIDPTMGADPQASRTVAQFALWQRGHINTIATFTAAGGIVPPTGGSGEFKGRDHAPGSSCDQPDVYAIRVPSGKSPAPLSGHSTNGASPNIREGGTDSVVASETLIDWATIVGGGIIPDTTVLVPDDDLNYPVMLITGNLAINITSDTDVFGTLIVTGDLILTGPERLDFNGILLVGGRIQFLGADARFDGMVVSGSIVMA